jgi:hypothetical protein
MDPRTGQLPTEAMTFTGTSIVHISIPLRHNESLTTLNGYPGGDRFTVILGRPQLDDPTQFEVLTNKDADGLTRAASVSSWSNFAPRAETDVNVGVAWLSPSDYVVPVWTKNFPQQFGLRLYHVGCEAAGSKIIYRGTDIDIGQNVPEWTLLAAGPDRLLALRKDELALGGKEGPKSARWMELRLGASRLEPTAVQWTPGAWAWVSPSVPLPPKEAPPGCERLSFDSA